MTSRAVAAVSMAALSLAAGTMLYVSGCKSRQHNAHLKKLNIPVAYGKKAFAFHRVFRKKASQSVADAFLTREVFVTSRGELELQPGPGVPLESEWARLLPAFGASRADPNRLRIDKKEGTPLHSLKGSGIHCTWTYLGRHKGKALAASAGHCLSNNDMESSASICHRMVIDWEKIASEDAQPQTKAAAEANTAAEQKADTGVLGQVSTRCKDVLASYHYNRGGIDSPAWNDAGFEQWSADFAVIEIDVSEGEPGSKLDIAHRRPEDGEAVTLFSHPKGRPLEWSGVCAARFLPYDIWREYQRVVRKDAAFDFNYDEGIRRFIHSCNAQEGSSGAAVVSVKDKTIVGFHNGGVAFGAAWQTIYGNGGTAEMHRRWNRPYTSGMPLNVATFATWVPWEGVLER